MTSYGKIIEQLTRHQIGIQQFSGSQVKRALPILRELARDLRKRIQAGDATEFAMNRMVVLERDIQEIVLQATAGIQGALDLDDFAVQEVAFTERLLGAAISIDLGEGVAPETIRALTTRRQMQLVSGDTVKRLTIPQMFDDFAQGVSREALREVQKGVIEGKTQQQMARGVAELVTTRSRRQAETVIRTSVNGIGNAARQEVYQANGDILKGERWISTLDSRVTILCAGRDQELYPVGQGPMPPAHYGCRSIRSPEVKDEYRIAAKGERASIDGPVSNQLSYGGFLKNQSKEFQDSVLGTRRAELFRSGRLKIDQFTDDLGRTLSLDELAARFDLDLA